MGRMLVRVAEISQGGRIATLKVVAESNIEARGLVIRHLGNNTYDSIRVRDTPETDDGPPRVIVEGN
jgi:hypothetical protein